MVVFLRSIHASVDSRLTRYVMALEKVGRDALVIQWARGGSGEFPAKRTKFSSFSLKAGLGGGWKNALALIFWMAWAFSVLFKERKNTEVVHAIDLDTVLPALLFCKVFRKKLIFDIYDSYGDARSMSGAGRKVVDALEGFAARHADHVILPDTCRLPQVPAAVKDITIIENVPFKSGNEGSARRVPEFAGVTLAYVGILEERHRGLEDLLAAVALYPGKVELEIAGFGPLAEACAKAAREHQNIRFHGAVTPEQAIRLMDGCDVVVGMYYRTKAHHARATPNKYYEHLMLSKPLLTTKGTPPGEKVELDYSGWALQEGESSLKGLFDSITRATCRELGANASKKWNADYANYFQEILVEKYARNLCSA
jgi:hypothetical protein